MSSDSEEISGGESPSQVDEEVIEASPREETDMEPVKVKPAPSQVVIELESPMSPSPEMKGMPSPGDPTKSDSPQSFDDKSQSPNITLVLSPSSIDESKTQSERDSHIEQAASEKPGDTVKENVEPDTEMVSEDEFPPEGVKHLDTEAVSDEELQELPAADLETEAVSDEELPPVKKKRKHRRHSGSDDDHSTCDKKKKRRRRSSDEKKSSHRSHGKEKKRDKAAKSSSKGRSRDASPRRKQTSKSSKSSKSKVLPELEKYWKAVRDDPSDFTGWTYLLQYVDQENDVDAAREAYDAFLRIYPYCYGYWRKYADYEKHKGDRTKCEEVFARGLKAIPLSVDLWLHYLNFCKSTMKDNESLLRDQFERAIDRCGLEFRSDRLWDFYIKWEMDLKNYQNVFAIYDRLLKTPVLGFKTHFENFEDFVHNHQPSRILSVGEFVELRADVVQTIKERGIATDGIISAPPGDDREDDDPARADSETTLMREKITALRKKVFKNTAAEVAKRWKYEEGIKRPYFHVKPLEKCQVNSWRDYLDFEIASGDMHRTVILFERCLIACALYEEFWLKYIHYLEGTGENDALIRNVYQRACLIHHCKKTYLALEWASFEETKGNIEGARKVLNYAEKQVPSLLLIYLRRINLERRANNLEGAAKLYEYYLKNNTRNPSIFNALSAKYARFCELILNEPNKAIDIMKKAIDKFPDELQLYIALLDLHMARGIPVADCVAVFDKILNRESFDRETKIIFAQRKIEFLEDFGCDIFEINNAHVEYSNMMKKANDPSKTNTNRDEKLGSDESRAKLKNEAVQAHLASSSVSSAAYSNSAYNNSYQSSQGYSNPNVAQYSQVSYGTNSNQYGTADQNSSNYHNWNYSQSNYGSTGQSWGGYNYYS